MDMLRAGHEKELQLLMEHFSPVIVDLEATRAECQSWNHAIHLRTMPRLCWDKIVLGLIS